MRRGPFLGHRRLEEDRQTAADAQREGVLQRARSGRHVLGVAVLVVRPGLGVRALVQLAQVDAVDHTVTDRAGHQGVLGSRHRAEQQRSRLQPAEVVPVALLGGVHREQVQGAGRDQPQYLRTLQVQTVEPGAVDPRAQRAERAHDEVALVPLLHCRHLTAP